MKLAIFDFDGTLLTDDTLPSLGREWLRQKRSLSRYYKVLLSVAPVLIKYKGGLMSREAMKGQAFKRFNRIFTGMSRPAVEEFFLLAYPYLRKLFNEAVLEEIRLAREQGFHCVLLSGAYIELLQLAARDLGMDTVLGARLVFKDEVFDPHGETRFVDGAGKRALLFEAFAGQNIDWEQSRAFGDSFADICIIETVGEKVAVNPDLELLEHAQKNRWRIVRG
ncbi:MAG: HAD-IB family phosphatase [Syntrophomonadaceae bacterium]